jgi:hypothetical protein
LNLLAWARKVSEWIDAPVYLVGSALRKSDPRDIDIRAILSDAQFAERFGPVDVWVREGETGQWTDVRLKWSRFCTRLTKQAWRLTGQNVDFQVYPRSWSEKEYGGEPKELLREGRE